MHDTVQITAITFFSTAICCWSRKA